MYIIIIIFLGLLIEQWLDVGITEKDEKFVDTRDAFQKAIDSDTHTEDF